MRRAFTVALALAVLALLATSPAPATHTDDAACLGSATVDLQSLGGDQAAPRFGNVVGTMDVDLRALGGDPAGHECAPPEAYAP